MWKCIKCHLENMDDIIICSCGYERSKDISQFRSIVQLNNELLDEYTYIFLKEKNVTIGRSTEQNNLFATYYDLAVTDNAEAQNYIGNCYYDGKDVTQDYVTAFE